ncbi:MAG: T9SS type A sorting domain-containing protein [Ignavibacteriaceae bacterium]|nr:T9SS type A sorting domain-containing protein [Ignavibacteriaceae bacterium]
MKRIVTLIFLLGNIISAATGWFQDYVIINKDNGGNVYYWIGSDPSFGSQFHGHNFGIITSSTTLVITGADMKYWSDNQDRTGGAFYWQVKDANSNAIPGLDAHEIIWTQSGPNGNDYQGLWFGNINILSGLSPSTSYTFHIWAKSWGTSQGDSWLSNSSANYVATFTTNSSFPVELTSFLASAKGKVVKLNWQTATEINNYGFDIERSQKSNVKSLTWEKIGFVNGHGNSNSPKSYSFVDKDVTSGNYIYRLKQIDNDGKFEYSKEVEVSINTTPDEFALLQNYPNPFNPSTTIKYALPSKEFVQLKVFNVLGNEVAVLVNEVQEAGNYKIEFNPAEIKSITSGMYFYRLEAGSFVESRKMTFVK